MGELSEEGVARNIEDTVAMDIEVDMVGRDDNGVGKETIDAEGWAEGKRDRGVLWDLLFQWCMLV